MSAAGRPALLTRRGFVQAASGVVAAHAFAPALHALTLLHAEPLRLACRVVEGGIETLRVQGNAWTRADLITCEAPSALALHPAGKILYVAHGTDTFQHLPAGSLGCYHVQPDTGALSLLHREALSLACTQPDGLAASPDGKLLIVASGQTGILNVLPLDEEGVPGAVTTAHKDLQRQARECDSTGPGSLRLRFVSDRTFVVSGAAGQSQTIYGCSDYEITLLERRNPFASSAAVSRDEEALPDLLRKQGDGLIWM